MTAPVSPGMIRTTTGVPLPLVALPLVALPQEG